MPKSLLNKTYGKLKVIKYLGKRMYMCECECGNTKEVLSNNLHGDMCCDNCKKGFIKDLTGNMYGLLFVKSYNKKSKKWICECKCGETIEVKSNNLKSSNTSSCGKCKYIEVARNDVISGTRVSQIRRMIGKNNVSGKMGVSYNIKRNRWVSAIRFQGVNYFLGYYLNKEDAIKARESAEKELHGNFLNWYNLNYKNKEVKNE